MKLAVDSMINRAMVVMQTQLEKMKMDIVIVTWGLCTLAALASVLILIQAWTPTQDRDNGYE